MKAKLLLALICVSAISTPMLAKRPAVGGLQEQLDTLGKTLGVCPPGAPTRFVDNGDGTICDHETGLMWEKKNASDNKEDLFNPHDVDNNYTFSANTAAPKPGTAFTHFLARLNGELASAAPSEQLGGYRDWRLPTSVELQTILDCRFGSPCIDPIFGPTTAFTYWSSTADANEPIFKWRVSFDNGRVMFGNPFGGLPVRAVRGGSWPLGHSTIAIDGR